MHNIKYLKQTIFVSLIMALTSCMGNNSNEYIYLETAMLANGITTAPKELKPLLITAVSDSAAYIKAYKEFCFSKKVYDLEFQESGTMAGKPLSFKLLNKDSIDISKSVSFINKEKWEYIIEKRTSEYELKRE